MAFDFSNRIKKIVQLDIRAVTIEVIHQNSDYLSELLKRQLSAGLDGNNNEVKVFGNSYYAPLTIRRKREPSVSGLGRNIEWITNYMTGAFYAGVKPLTNGNLLTFNSNVPYFLDIVNQSGGIIMKLNDYHLELFKKEKLYPELKRRMTNGI